MPQVWASGVRIPSIPGANTWPTDGLQPAALWFGALGRTREEIDSPVFENGLQSPVSRSVTRRVTLLRVYARRGWHLTPGIAAVGYPSTAVGYPSTAVGYPQPPSVALQPPSVTPNRRPLPFNRRLLPFNRPRLPFSRRRLTDAGRCYTGAGGEATKNLGVPGIALHSLAPVIYFILPLRKHFLIWLEDRSPKILGKPE